MMDAQNHINSKNKSKKTKELFRRNRSINSRRITGLLNKRGRARLIEETFLPNQFEVGRAVD